MTGAARMAAGSPLRVFLVEDSVPIRERLVESLASGGSVQLLGYADTEASALAVLRRASWDVVILDLQLRQGNGFKLLKALRDARAPGAKVIIFTNYAFPLFRSKSEQLGADYFFDKAREFNRLRDVISSLARENESSGSSAARAKNH